MFAIQREVEVQHNLLTRLADARKHTDQLLEIVRPEALYSRPIPERHRIVFYIGHLEAFDWNLFRPRTGIEPFDSKFDQLFAFGIDPVDGGLPSDQPGDWPSLSEARQYVSRIREGIDSGLEALTAADWDSGPVGADFSASSLLNVAIEHR